MGKKIKVYFGNSIINPEIIYVMEQGDPMEYIVTDEEERHPVYSSEVESWLARTDMEFSLYEIDRENLAVLTSIWGELVKSAFAKPYSGESFHALKKRFTDLAAQ